ncbi:MAG: biliverdin-producing heme oxygenase [Roseovarius sp.]|jgi:heme oxygenase|uniref:biliverdin-producing heme oxygenase n=1 Tax=Roseovarius sp. TaxID=1486281 RepID=UPI0032EEDAD0
MLDSCHSIFGMREFHATVFQEMVFSILERRVFTAKGSPRNISLRDQLRAATHQQHERLHEHPCFLALFNESLCIGDYRDLILRLYGFYQPLDRAIGRAISCGAACTAGYDYAERAGYLAQDLADLGWSAEAIEESPRCNEAFDIVSPASLGGILYVIEGATLGGARIDRAARRLLAREDQAGRRFWSWCRTVGGHRWPMTNRYLEDLEADGAAVSDLREGARDTFRLLADWLAPLDHSTPLAVARVP